MLRTKPPLASGSFWLGWRLRAMALGNGIWWAGGFGAQLLPPLIQQGYLVREQRRFEDKGPASGAGPRSPPGFDG